MKYMNIRNLGHDKWELMFFMALSMTTFLLLSSISTAYAHNTDPNTNSTYRDQAKRMHDRLVGVPPTEVTLNIMANYIDPGVDGTTSGGTNLSADPVAAASYAIDPPDPSTDDTNTPEYDPDPQSGNSRAKYFYNVTLKNWVTPWTNEDQTVFVPLNDYTATVIGMIRDEVPFSQVLSRDILYVGNESNIQSDLSVTIPGHAPNSNAHYEALESNDIDLSTNRYLEQSTQSGEGMAGGAAGIMTTRAAGQAFFEAGTNRAMFRFTSMNYLCRDLEDLKDVARNPDHIRQDVSRSPGGDSSIFLNSCIGCHAGMDPLAQAYAYYEWNEDTGFVEYTANDVQAKYHINSTNFEYGYRTPDNSWRNYWRIGPNRGLGWGTEAEVNAILAGAQSNQTIAVTTETDADSNIINEVSFGTGAASMGAELAATEAFAQCQVEKVYKQVCLQDPIEVHNGDIESLSKRFMNQQTPNLNYNMKNLFAEVAALCRGN
jgi:hypothetical protein